MILVLATLQYEKYWETCVYEKKSGNLDDLKKHVETIHEVQTNSFKCERYASSFGSSCKLKNLIGSVHVKIFRCRIVILVLVTLQYKKSWEKSVHEKKYGNLDDLKKHVETNH